MREGELPQEDSQTSGEPRPYNLVGEERSVSRQYPGIEIVHDRLVRHLRQSFSTLIGTSVGIEIRSADLLRYARFRNRLETGSPLCLFSIKPLHGNGLLSLGPKIMFELVDRVFGGQGAAPSQFEAREYSPVEMQVVGRIASLVLNDLEQAWSMVAGIECRFLRTEMNAAVAAIAASEDVVFVIELETNFGSGPTHFTLALPIGILEPVRNALAESQSVPAKADESWLASLSEAVRHAEVDVSVELGRRELSAGDLLQLEIGHLLELPTHQDDPVAICIEGQPVMNGIVGSNRGQHAVRVLSFTEEG